MASPQVAGVAALMLSVDPDLTSQQLRTNLMDSGTWINVTYPSGFLGSTTITVRRLNALEALKAVSTYNTRVLSATTIDIRGTFKNLTGIVVIPETLNGRTVTEIGPSAFANNQNLTNITIPSTVTYVGANAFLECSNLTINITGLTSIPNTWNSNYNPNNRPVSFNGVLCTHLNGGTYAHTQAYHIFKCNDCWGKTTSNHSYTNNGSHKVCECGFELCLGSHNLSYQANIGMGTHYQGCSSCDYMSSNQKCLTPMGQPGEIVYCIKCGQEIILGRGMFKIVMPNGKTYLATEKLTYNEYLDLAEYLEIEVTYLDYLKNEYSKMANKDMETTYY